MPRRSAALLCAVLTATGSAALAGAGPARAANPVATMPLSNFTALVAANNYAYLIGNRTNAVVVRNALAGSVASIPLNAAPEALAASVDGTRVYVAMPSIHAVAAISTSTNAEVARYDTGSGTCPSTLAVLGSKVLFGSGCTVGAGGIGIVDTSVTPATVVAPTDLGFYGAPLIAASAALPGRVFGAMQGMSPSTVVGFDLSGTTFTRGPSVDVGSNLGDLAISADGADLITASGSPYYHPRWHTSDLTADGDYATTNYPNSVAVASNGAVAAGLNGVYSPDVYIYSGATQVRSYDFAADVNGSTTLVTHGLSFSGRRLFAVTADVYGANIQLHVLADALTVPSTLSLRAPTTATRGAPITLTGALVAGGKAVAGATVRVARADLDGAHALTSVLTTSTGQFTVHDSPPVGGTVHYTVTFAGDADHGAATRTATVAVSRATPYLTITTSHASYHYGDRAYVSAHLGTTYRSRTVAVYARPYGGALALLRRANVDAHGNLTVTYTMTRRTTFEAVFGGDERYASRAVLATRTVSAKMATALRGYYTTSNGYRLFHSGTDGGFAAGVAPAKPGETVYFPLQGYSNGAWRTLLDKGFALDSNSVTAVSFHCPKGLSCRLRAVYGGDSANTGAGSGWYYVRFV